MLSDPVLHSLGKFTFVHDCTQLEKDSTNRWLLTGEPPVLGVTPSPLLFYFIKWDSWHFNSKDFHQREKFYLFICSIIRMHKIYQ